MAAIAEGFAQVNELASGPVLTAWGAASDFLIVLILLGVLFLFAWYMNYGQLVALLLSFYAAYAFYAAFPYLELLPTAPALTALLAHLGLYLAFALLFYIILRRVVVSDFLHISIFGVLVLSFLGATFLIALMYHVFPLADVYQFSPAMDTLFALKEYFYWWFIAPAVGLFFLAR